MFSETRLTVRYAETDKMGVVHHSNYPVWFEAGRTDLIRMLGMTYSEVEAMGYMLPLLELRCSYKGFTRYEDEVVVRSRVRKMTPTRLTFAYEVFKIGSDQPVTSGETDHVWTDLSLKPVNLKKHAPEIFASLALACDSNSEDK